MNRKYNIENLKTVIESSFSYAECLRKLGLRPTGGNYKNIQRNIDLFKIDISHMKHQSWSQGKEIKPFENITGHETIKARLIKIYGHSCQMCLISNWLGCVVNLELDHIDGNNRNNTKENLRLLCPNCHSTTPTWRNRKR